MQERLDPLNPAAVDPRLVPHLEPGETVLWQNQPKPGSFFGPPQIAGGLALIALGIALASGLISPQLPDASRYGPAAAAAGTGLLLLITRWSRRAALWTYAITDRRLLSVLKGRVIRSVTPEQLDRFELRIKGDTVYWLKLIKRNLNNSSGTARGPDGIFVGFHGQPDPEAGLDLTIHDRPLETTLDAVLNDPFTTITGTEILSSDPDLQIGPFRGFSVIRRMPGKEVRSVQALSAPAMLRQVWLGHAGMSLELQGYALESQQDVQNAIDAMVDSLTLQE